MEKSNCSFNNWFPLFKHVTINSRVVPVDQQFIDYLLDDSIFLPLDRNGLPQPSNFNPKSDKDEYDSDEDIRFDYDDNPDDLSNSKIPHFPLLQQKIDEAIADVGGVAFAKLNWSSPKDASWIAVGSSLKCITSADVFLLLKSSDFVSHDLCYPYDAYETTECESDPFSIKKDDKYFPKSYHIVLRKWYDLSPSLEFRCFVKDDNLIAISQRDYTVYYEFLKPIQAKLADIIKKFYEDNIKGKFASQSYTFDIYINKSNYKTWLIDFNPFSQQTDPLLFSWEELNHMDSSSTDFRLTESQSDADFNCANQPAYNTNRIPKDSIDLSLNTSVAGYVENVMRSLEMATLNLNDDDDDDDE